MSGVKHPRPMSPLFVSLPEPGLGMGHRNIKRLRLCSNSSTVTHPVISFSRQESAAVDAALTQKYAASKANAGESSSSTSSSLSYSTPSSSGASTDVPPTHTSSETILAQISDSLPLRSHNALPSLHQSLIAQLNALLARFPQQVISNLVDANNTQLFIDELEKVNYDTPYGIESVEIWVLPTTVAREFSRQLWNRSFPLARFLQADPDRIV
ncbi:hypothetical protein WAI453_013712 [Rhynchosporium graminicola]